MPILSTKNTIACVRLLQGLKSPTPPAPRPGDDKIIQELGEEPIYILLENSSSTDFIIQE